MKTEWVDIKVALVWASGPAGSGVLARKHPNIACSDLALDMYVDARPCPGRYQPTASICSRGCAAVLISLILLPFTAPWSVCSVRDMGASLAIDQSASLPSPAVSPRSSFRQDAQTDPATAVVAPLESRQLHARLMRAQSTAGTLPVVARLVDLSPSRGRPSLSRLADAERPPVVLSSLRL